jgi:TonB family protein
MEMPLRSDELSKPIDVQFAHFGVLNSGSQSKPLVFASTLLNVAVLFIFIVISAAAKKSIDNRHLLTELTEPVVPKKVEPIKPKFVPPPPPPPPVLPNIPRIEVQLPRIVVVKTPDVPKPPEVKMDAPKPVINAPAPTRVVAMAAPQIVNLALKPQAASVPNNDAHPSPVRLGNPTSPLNNLHGPAVSSVNLGAGFAGMNSANTGNGPRSTKVVLGNGSPGGTSIHGNSVAAVAGIPHGVPAGTATNRQAVSQVNLAQATPPPAPRPAPVASLVQPKPAKVTAKPKPEYTAEARQLHIEGIVTLRIRVQPNGSVEVLSVVSGLGHGLDESAKRAILATKFEPATDGFGHPVAWDGIVNVTFQLAG